jgi:hypothetical protein
MTPEAADRYREGARRRLAQLLAADPFGIREETRAQYASELFDLLDYLLHFATLAGAQQAEPLAPAERPSLAGEPGVDDGSDDPNGGRRDYRYFTARDVWDNRWGRLLILTFVFALIRMASR